MKPMALLQGVTPGIVTQVMVGPCAQVGIDNDSPYDAWISFAPQAPLAVPSPTTLQLFDGVARSMATTYLPVPDATTPFNGVIYVGIFDPAGLASSGVTSSRANIYISAWQQGETPGAVFAVPRLADTSNQPRNIAIPIAMTHWAQGQISSGTTARLFVIQSFTLTAAQKAALTCTYYFYYGFFSVYQVPANGVIDLALAIQFTHGGSPTGSVFNFGRISLWNSSGGTSSVIALNPAHPLVFQFNGSVPANADGVEFALSLLGASASITFNYTVASNLDLSNLVPVADIGTAALYNSTQASF